MFEIRVGEAVSALIQNRHSVSLLLTPNRRPENERVDAGAQGSLISPPTRYRPAKERVPLGALEEPRECPRPCADPFSQERRLARSAVGQRGDENPHCAQAHDEGA
jgi:hypothetical protein